MKANQGAQNAIRNQKKAKSRKGKGNPVRVESTEKFARIHKPRKPDEEIEKTCPKVRKPNPKSKCVVCNPVETEKVEYTEELDPSQLGKPERLRHLGAMYQRKYTQKKIAEKAAAAKREEEEKKLQQCRDCRLELINMGPFIEAFVPKQKQIADP